MAKFPEKFETKSGGPKAGAISAHSNQSPRQIGFKSNIVIVLCSNLSKKHYHVVIFLKNYTHFHEYLINMLAEYDNWKLVT